MGKKEIKDILKHSQKPGMDEVEALKAQLDIAIGLITTQRMKIARLSMAIKNKGFRDPYGN